MRTQLTAYLNAAIATIILVVVGVTPLLFTSLTTDFFETPKIALLIGAALILFLLWSLKWVVQGKVTFTRTPFDLPLLLLLIVVVLSTFFSESRWVSLYGNFPKVHGSTVATVAYILFYFILTSYIRTQKQVKLYLYTLLLSSTAAALITLSSYFGLYLPLALAQAPNFTPTGSAFSTTALLALLLPVLLLSLVNRNQSAASSLAIAWPVAIILSSLFAVTIALTGTAATFLAALIGLGLVVFITKGDVLKKALPLLAIPVALALILLLAGFIPLKGGVNPLYQKRVNFPKEIQLDFSTSWKIAASSLRDTPFLGTGPSTFLANFTIYKPADFNSTKFWNLRFDNAFNEYLQVLATLGGLGLMALVFLSAMLFNISWRCLSQDEDSLTAALSISAIILITLWLFHASTPVLTVASLAILALLVVNNKTINEKVEELSLGIKATKLTDSNLIIGDILPVILFIPMLILVSIGLWNTGTTLLSDYYHRLALNSASTKALDTYNHLVKAESLNPKIDLYRTDLAQTNFAIANNIAAQKGSSEASPGGSLTDQDKQNIQQLLSQAINEAKVATVLNPRSAQNWEILASIYRQISGVAQNALTFSLDAYGRAIQKDPLNPMLRLNVGGVYYSVKNYDLAIRFFTDAINLKPDFANGYYNLAIALRDKGDLTGAQAAAEKVIPLLDTNSQDYKAAVDFLADIKSKSASKAAEIAETESLSQKPKKSSALQKKDLPKVLDLPEADKISTPEAVKKP